MYEQSSHLVDEELIRLIDGERSGDEKRDASTHPAECSTCRLRRLQLEQAVSKGHFFSRSTAPSTRNKPGMYLAAAMPMPDTSRN
jgi:hypothetical protein